MNFKRRLDKLEGAEEFPDVLENIRAHRYYDNLTEAEKDRYLLYQGHQMGHKEYEDLTIFFSVPYCPDFIHTPEDIEESGIFHFPLKYRSKQKGIDPERRREVEEYLNHVETESERKERLQETAELKRINELRKKAIANGEDPNQYPAPWQKEYKKQV